MKEKFKNILPFICFINLGIILLLFSLSSNSAIQRKEIISLIFINSSYIFLSLEVVMVGILINIFLKKNKFLNAMNVFFGSIFMLIFLSIIYFSFDDQNILFLNTLSFIIYFMIYIECVCLISMILNWLKTQQYKKIIKFIICDLIIFIISLLFNILLNNKFLVNELFQKINLILYYNCVITFISSLTISLVYKVIKVD